MSSFRKVMSLPALAAAMGFTFAGSALAQAPGGPTDQGPQNPPGAATGAPLVPGIAPPVGGGGLVPGLTPPALPQVVTPPPLPPPPPAVVFFFEQNGQPVGPLTAAELQARIGQGAIKAETLVWKQGTAAWVAAKDLPEVATLLPVAPPAIPQSEQYKRMLVGTWQAQQVAQTGVSTNSTITYSADGTYTALVTQTFQGFSYPAVGNGKWTLSATGDGQFGLTMTPGEFGTPPVTVVLRVVDNNTLSNDAEHYQARRIR